MYTPKKKMPHAVAAVEQLADATQKAFQGKGQGEGQMVWGESLPGAAKPQLPPDYSETASSKGRQAAGELLQHKRRHV